MAKPVPENNDSAVKNSATKTSKASKAAEKIRLLLLDVDGVLTDGRLYYAEDGVEQKAFHIQDGLGIKFLQRAGIEVGIITGRSSKMLMRRADELGINLVVQGREDKLVALGELLARTDYTMEEVAFIGDDLPDLAVIRRVGLGMTVADGNPTVAEQALWQSTRCGGRGAVREAAEFILFSQNKLDNLLEAYR